MKITRQRLKDIIMEEIALQEAAVMTNVPGDNTYDTDSMADISEAELEEGVEMVTLENIELLADVAAQMGVNFIPAIATAIAGMSLKDALEYLLKKKDAAKETETALEEAEEGTLEELITQAIQEELAQLASKNVK